MPSLIQRAKAAIHGFRNGIRAFDGARIGRTTADWMTSATSADAEIRASLRLLIDRSRDLERNNDYQRGFLLAAQRNINGSHKYDFRSDAGEWITKRTKDGKSVADWQPDQMAKRLIEDAWVDWGKKRNCTTTQRHSWRNVRRLSVRAAIRDGNVLIRKIRGKAAKNKYGFRLQLWEVDHLDLARFSLRGRNQNEIRFGIEFDHDDAPVAYWLRARHPGDYMGGGGAGDGYQSVRIPAEEIYFFALPDRAEQSVGVPWIVSAITRLRQLGAFEEAAVIAARVGATQSGFFKKTPGPGGGVGSWDGEKDSSGGAVIDAAPASFTELPEGWSLDPFTPHYPNIATGDFRKAMLRGVCASLGVSYTTLGNDLESVNFSSARIGLFDEREGWKELQLYFSEELWEEIFADWLEQAILSGAIALPIAKFAKFNRPVFKARRWSMLDPVKETAAAKQQIALRITSRRQIIEDQGGDVDEVFHDNLEDEQLADGMNLSLTPPDPEPESFGNTDIQPAKPGNGKTKPGSGDEDEDDEES
jgi:lambda family phage portal protein